MNYKRTPTSPEVWAVIMARHSDRLQVFGTYSAPDGDLFVGESTGVMQTSYGFEGSDYPLIEAKTTWYIDKNNPAKRDKEIKEYWLCIPITDD